MKKLLLFALLIYPFLTFSQIPTYYNDVNLSLSGMDLKEELATKVISTHSHTLTYSNIWSASKITDLDPTDSSNNMVILVYGYDDNDGDHRTDRTRSKHLNGGNQGTDWNREHTYAKSLGTPNLGTSGPGADAHHLRPADATWNSTRGNKKFAAGSGNSGPSNSGWYPGDEWKGDVARMMMYMYIRYDDRCKPTNVGFGSSSSTTDAMIDLFLEWNAEDPVSQLEKNRNTYHENTSNTYAQGNRNPFIDNPAFATQIWGGPQAEDLFNDGGGSDYCDSQGNSINDEYIQRVQLNSIDNSSSASSGYTDFTSISADLTKGNQYSISITPKWTGTIYSEGYAVWIDYNEDGDFTDSGELVWSKAASKQTLVQGSFTIPSTASETTTRMRVSMKYNGVPSSCESFSYGEVEDYTISITAGSSGGGCTATTLSITFDNYPKETDWTLKDNNGIVVVSGGPYTSEPNGSTKNIPICIDPGCYTFTIFDSYGDGICCNYGNGSYSFLKDADGSVIASGGTFTNSDATNFCINAKSMNSINESITTSAIVIYPNPTTKNSSISIATKFNLKDETITIQVRLFNLQGQLLKMISINQDGKNSFTDSINLSGLETGVYLINITNSNGFNSTKKLVIK